MHEPLADWDELDNTNATVPEKIVWGAQLDGRYQIEIQRIDNATASLCIFDHQDGMKELKCWDVTLSYGAMFGPDIDDVSQWMDMAADFVDNLNIKN